ncbi:hypothetical protein [Salisediminibacterium beveridgei]|uniref:Uncharacterized protein n=1 Tax=Salisediminibacterium beveridgei TaxID=632773 RepID=A0A1D7QSU2_9BACI|nr:hypothetical protein [Salisediminibacterium beveridgei]AOM82085.1 hypothetical protein BBEV_0713 [Salisediminibacterium beveridgei]
MNRNKWIILSIGVVLLIGLSAVALTLEDNSASEPGMGSDSAVNGTGEEDNSAPANDNGSQNQQQNGNLNITSDDEGFGADGQAADEEALIAAAEGLLSSMELSHISDSPSEESLLEQSELYYSYLASLEEGGDPDAVNDAEWTARELYVWFNMAQAEYDVQFDPDAYHSFIEAEQEREITEEDHDPSQRILFDVLESNYDTEAKRRQQDIHYLQPYLWTQMKEEAISRHSDGATDEENTSEALLEVEQMVFERMAQQYPDLVDN